MSFVLRIQGLVDGTPSPYDGLYLTRFDFDDCEPGQCRLHATAHHTEALRFESMLEALEVWKTVDPRAPLRPDGEPNRPLTAFSVSVEPFRQS
jgi:hypothetical protein